MKILCTSDWHGDAVTDGHRRLHDVCNAVGQAIEVGIEAGCKMHLFCGDLTDPDNSRSHGAVAAAIGLMAGMEEDGMPTVAIPGNHDVIEDGTGAHTLGALAAAGIRVLDTPGLYTEHGVKILALPYTPTSHTYDPAELVRAVHGTHGPIESLVVVGHLNLDGMHPGSETKEMPRGRDVAWPLDALRECYPNALLIGGHYHRAQEFKGVNIVGSPIRFTHGEEDHVPKAMVVEV